MEKEKYKNIRLPKFAYVFFAIFGISVVIYAIGINSTIFSDFFNRHVSSIFRGILATVTNILPISLAELLVILSPVILFFIVRFCIKKYSASWRSVGIFTIAMLSVISLLFSAFVFTFGLGYYTSELDEKLGLEQRAVSADELAQTAEWLISKVNSEIESIDFKEKSSSIMPCSIREMNEKLLLSYNALRKEHSFIPQLISYVKPIILSEPMTYTHISGVYTYFTGEANINTNAPDYSIPFTAAHELAHQRGIAREDEANFIAFLVCSQSEDAYIRYCGYLNLCEYVLNSLYSANRELWETTYKKLDNLAIYEMIAYNKHYEKYRDNVVGEISGAINDAYLQANGTEGTVSYGLVVDLAVAYYHQTVADGIK